MKIATRRGLIRIAIVLGVIIAAYLMIAGATSIQLRHVYKTVAERGFPVHVDEVIPPQIPDSDNRAPLYQQAWEAYDDPDYVKRTEHDILLNYVAELARDYLRDELPPQQRPELFTYLDSERTRSCLQFVVAANAREHCRFDLNYEDGPNTLLPHLNRLRSLSRLTCAKPKYAAANGQSDAAWDLVIEGLQLVKSVESEPFIISQLVRIAQLSIVANVLDDICRYAVPSDAQWRTMTDLLYNLRTDRPMENAFHGERLIVGSWTYDNAYSELAGDDGGSKYYGFHLAAPYFRMDEAAHTRYWAILASRNRCYDWPESWCAPVPTYYHFASLMAAALGAAWTKQDGYTSMLHIMWTGMALHRFHGENDQWPETLDELDTSETPNQFHPLVDVTQYGAAHVYIPGEIVYGFGTNLVDDQGARTDEGRDLDICFRLKAEDESE